MAKNGRRRGGRKRGPGKIQVKIYLTPVAKKCLEQHCATFGTNQSVALENAIRQVLHPETLEAHGIATDFLTD